MWRHVALNSKAAEDQLAAYQNAIEALEVCLYHRGEEIRNFSSSVEIIQLSKRNFVSPSDHVIFFLLYNILTIHKHTRNDVF